MTIATRDRTSEADSHALLRRYRDVVESLPAAVYTCDLEGRIVLFNQAAVTLWGRTPKIGHDQWCGSWKIYRLDGTELPLDECTMAEALRSGCEVHGKEIIVERPDGTRRHVLPHPEPIRDADGQIVGAMNMLVDVTERRHAEDLLRESEERFRTLANHAPVGIFQSAANGDTVFVNDSWCAMTGLTREQARGEGWVNALHPDDRQRVLADWSASVRRGVASEAEFRFVRTDGEVVWLHGNAVPLRNSDGDITGYIGTVADINNRKQAEEALRESDRRKDEFLAILAHELRNPLAPIRTGLELMRLSGNDRDMIEEIRLTMERQAQQMVRLIDDLLDVSRITRGTIELRKSRVELAAVIESAVEAVRPLIEESRQQLSISLPKQPIVLDADQARLAQVVSNLLNNASKYMSAGGEIRLTARRDGRIVEISIQDAGIGIPPEMLGRIFDMFTQVDRSLERSHGGLGIGLTLVKRLVEMHGGTVAAHSPGPDQGSEFVICLPIVVELLSQPQSDNGTPMTSPGKRRIMVVDDNEQAAKVLGMLLKVLGNDVRTAFDGASALEIAAEFHPDIMFLDIGMPRLNGYDTARRIREQPWGKDILLAALTGWGQEEDKRRTREAGFHHHFVKPVEPATIQKLLTDHESSVR